ncbi:MAG: hypothetical protein H7838_13470 [Magnetococcus sp. DMHC-8]
MIKAYFSLVELAIALILTGLVGAAVLASQEVAQQATVRTAYQTVVVPCLAAVHEALRQGATEAHAVYPVVHLDGASLACRFAASTGHQLDQVTITGAPSALQTLMQQNLADGSTTRVESATITINRLDR